MRSQVLWQPVDRPKTWAEARLNSIIPLESNRPATVDERIAYGRDVNLLTPGQREELELLQKAKRDPMREYARWFEKFLKKDQENAEKWREFFPLSEYIAAEREYLRQAGKSYAVQFRGQVGSGKSLAAQRMEQDQDPDFIPREQTYFLYENLQAMLQRDWPSGKAFVMDEEPNRGGEEAHSIDRRMENLELVAFRRKLIDNAWVYVEQRAHRIRNLFTMDGEFFSSTGIAEYFTCEVSQPYQNVTEFLHIGRCVFRVPPREKVDEYYLLKDEFVEKTLKSGGIGPQRNSTKNYATITEEVKEDARNPNGEIRKIIDYWMENKPSVCLGKVAAEISYRWALQKSRAESLIIQSGILGIQS